MKNRLVIVYHEDKVERPETESLRCTSMDGAKKIMSKRNSSNMKSAIYTNDIGSESNMKKVKR